MTKHDLDAYAERTPRAQDHFAFLQQMRDAPRYLGVNDHLGNPVLEAVELLGGAATALDSGRAWHPSEVQRLRNIANLLLALDASRIDQGSREVLESTYQQESRG